MSTPKSGISLVQVTLADSDKILKATFDKALVAEVQNVQKVSKRQYVKNGTMVSDENPQEKLSLVTSDKRLPELMKLLKVGGDVPADIVVTSMDAVNQSYVDWVKSQTRPG